MKRYFFHVHNHTADVRDEEGRELDSVEKARSLAIRDIRSILSEEALEGIIDLTGRLEIANGDDETLLTVGYDEAIELRLAK